MFFGSKKPTLIETDFVGGPLDGLTQYFFESDLKPALAFPVSPKLFQQIKGIDDATSCRPSSVAFYFYNEQVSGSGVKYHFAGAESPESLLSKSS